MQALFERSYSLGLVTATDRTSFYKAMNARGWKTREPDGDHLGPEIPELVAAIGERLRGKGLSDREVGELAGFADGSVDHPFAISERRRLQVV